MNTIAHEYILGCTRAVYVTDGALTGLALVPAELSDASFGLGAPEPLVQVYAAGEPLEGGFSAGRTMRNSAYVKDFREIAHTHTSFGGRTEITTVLENERCHRLIHTLEYDGGRALTIRCAFENCGSEDVPLDMLSSFTLGCITPYCADPDKAEITLHRALSNWSVEGRIQSISADDLSLEKSWSGHGIRIEKWGQTGSMPVRGYFPFAAVTDDAAKAAWAVQLEAPASWQMELVRRDGFFDLSGGIADHDMGHFRKSVKPGERYEAPAAHIAAVAGGLEDACNALQADASARFRARHPEPLPLFYNEYCQSWGNPNRESVKDAVDALRDNGIGADYFVIDAGWFLPETGDWSQTGGDWSVSKKLFPNGMRETTDYIKSAGMKAGVWFEPETCAPRSSVWQNPDMLATVDGKPLTVGARRFLDLRKPAAREYLDRSVGDMLADNGFQYIKTDYNDSIGIGCDGGDSEGESLQELIASVKDFYASLKKRVPDLMMELCSSGGHRLEPGFLDLFDTASFSDAHECPEIPVVAANLHYLMAPAEEQIWAVLRPGDSRRRLVYTVAAASLGALCLSGDIAKLNPEQMRAVREGVEFYRAAAPVTLDGETKIYRSMGKKYRSLEGWQAVVRRGANGHAYAVVHTFGGDVPDTISFPMPGDITSVYTHDGVTVSQSGGTVSVRLSGDRNFAACAIVTK